MIKTMTPAELQQSDIRELLVQILTTGESLKIRHDGKLFQIALLEQEDKLDDLEPHPEVYVGDPDDLVNISWEHELNLDLP